MKEKKLEFYTIFNYLILSEIIKISQINFKITWIIYQL